MTSADVSEHGETLVVDIPLRIRRRGGRKVMLAPDGASAWVPPRARVDSAMVKAIARAYRWRGMIEQGVYASITELAAAERINQSYVCRVLRLTLIAPGLVEAILDGRHPSGLQLRTLLNPFPSDWTAQAHYFAKEPAFGVRKQGQVHRAPRFRIIKVCPKDVGGPVRAHSVR
jgi:hypothetical protein